MWPVFVGEHRHPDDKHGDVIHAATTAPVCLYSVDTRSKHLSCVDLYELFRGATGHYRSYQPRLRIAPLAFPLDTNIVIHDELVRSIFAAVALLPSH